MGVDPSVLVAWLAGMLIAALVILLFWRAMFSDRSRGRRRCPSCWHDMSGAPTLRCPECGHDARHERRLFATRRRWRRAFGLVAALVVTALVVRVRVTGENLFEYAPTWALCAALPYTTSTPAGPGAPPFVGPIQRALDERILKGRVDAETLDRIASIILAGDAGARPPSVEWEARYGRLINVLRRASYDAVDRGETDAPIFAIVDRFRVLPPRSTLTVATSVPSGAPLYVSLRVEDWWPPTTHARVRVRDVEDGTEQIMGLDAGASGAGAFPFSFAPVRDDERQRRFRITIETRRSTADGQPDRSAPWGPIHVVERVVAFTVGGSTIALQPTSSKALDEAMAQVFSQGMVVWRTGLRRFGLRFDPSRTAEPSFDGVVLGLDVQILEDDVVRRHSRMWWPAGSSGRQTQWQILSEDLSSLERLDPAATNWTVKIIGDRDVAHRPFVNSPTGGPSPYAMYWSGQLTLPLSIQFSESAAPRRRWFILPEADVPLTDAPVASGRPSVGDSGDAGATAPPSSSETQ
ncbi:MAG: hypothetical protein SGJ11_09620 [Phycisphaerae bacterium]|nr:hypothetical protein [Phycisphaerae bacterium]